MRILLITGGIFQALVALLHVALIGWIENELLLNITGRELMHMLNVAVMLSAGLFSFLTFKLLDTELMNKIGSPVLLFIFVFYVVRAFEECLFGQFSIADFCISLVIAGIYLAVFLLVMIKKPLKSISNLPHGITTY